jgi:hypothetical protein
MTTLVLPAGFAVHCAACGVVVPADAPRPASGADCAWVVQHKMAWFNPQESIRGQHTMATAAWKLIHHAAVEGSTPDAASVAYWQQYRKDPKKHFVASVARTSLTPAQVTAQLAMPKQGPRDKHFYS